MRFIFLFALRYLFSKKTTNAIQVISFISMIGITFGTAALLVILSVFNGFEDFITSMYSKTTADLLIRPSVGKSFEPSKQITNYLTNNNSIYFYSKVLEDNVLLQYGDAQYFGRLKGVDSNYTKNTNWKGLMERGEFILTQDSIEYLVISKGVEYNLGINLAGAVDQITVFAPRKSVTTQLLNAENSLNRYNLFPSGIFYAQQELDQKTVFASLTLARSLFEVPTNISSIEVFLKKDQSYRVNNIKKDLQKLSNNNYTIEDRLEQNKTLYKVLNSEKLAIYIILTLVLLIAILNIVGSITMLILDKRKDINILKSMGAQSQQIRWIFVLQAFVLCTLGTLAGLGIGTLVCWIQQTFKVITFQQSGNLLLDAYPVKMIPSDFLLVSITVISISFIASYFATSVRYNK